jgi:low temperature requirement protein LtrA
MTFTRMVARAPHEPHRAATPLELFFDLVFVVAIAQAAAGLHHAIGAAHTLDGLVGYLMVFFAIWWAWMNFTWFASAYDCDDAPYRLAVFVQITGALIMAAGVPDMFEHRAPNGATLGGYVVMLLITFSMWWVYFDRPAHDLLTGLRTALVWGYGHYVILAAVAAAGAGIAVSVDQVVGQSQASSTSAGFAIAVPVAIYLVCLWALHDRPEYRRARALGPLTAVLVLGSPFTGQAALVTGLLLVLMLMVKARLLSRPAHH